MGSVYCYPECSSCLVSSPSETMILRLLLLYAAIAAVSEALDLLEALKAYDHSIKDRHFTTRSKLEVTPEDVLGYQRSLKIFPSKGVAVTNHVISLSVPVELFRNISKQLDELQKIDPTNINVKEAMESKEQTKTIIQSICNTQLDGPQKRFIIGTLLVTFIASIAASSLTTVGIYASLGQFDSTTLVEEELGLKEKQNDEQKALDVFFLKKLKQLKKETHNLAHRLQINDAAAIIDSDFKTVLKYLETLTSSEAYDFGRSRYLENVEETLANNTEFSRLMAGSKQFGLSGTTTLLSLSESESLLMSEDDRHLCESSSVISKFKTIIPDEENVATGTLEKYKFKLDDERSLYINPNSLLEKSKFRPVATFTKSRTIIGRNKVITNIIPYNNTHLFVKTSGNFKIEKSCKNVSNTINIFKNPFIRIPEHCSIKSDHLNISEFRVFYTLHEVDPAEEIHGIQDVDFSPLYDHNDAEDLEDYEMEKKINEIWGLGKRITTIEKEILANRADHERIKEGFNNFFAGIADGLVGMFDTVIADPFYQVVTALVLILFCTCLGLWLRRRKAKKAKKQAKIVSKTADSDE